MKQSLKSKRFLILLEHPCITGGSIMTGQLRLPFIELIKMNTSDMKKYKKRLILQYN